MFTSGIPEVYRQVTRSVPEGYGSVLEGYRKCTGGLPEGTGGLPERTGGLPGLIYCWTSNIEQSMCNLS